MGKKQDGKRVLKSESGSHTPVSLREEATGKIQTKATSSAKSILKIEHAKDLAVWASSLIPPLGAFYGQHLASLQEATGVPPDPSLITCQRCESVLQPGFNSTVRIEKNRSRVRHRLKKSSNITQNNVVYNCHFCLHRNLKRGTPKGYLKGKCPSKDKSLLASTPSSKPIIHDSSKLEKGIICKHEADEIDVFASRIETQDVPLTDGLATPPTSTTKNLLEGNKKRNSLTSKKATETASTSAKVEVAKTLSTTASKRRRKSWTSLKEIAQSNERDNSQASNLTIPFFL